jgi:hypothetical protein
MNQIQLSEAFDAKVRGGIFRPIGRFLTRDPDGGEERLQDGICATWDTYLRYGLRGKILDDPLLVHSCRLRAVDTSRHFVPGDGTRKNCDAMSQHAFRTGKVPAVLSVDDTESTPHLLDNLYQARNPTRFIISRLDLERWIGGLAEEDRIILGARLAGEDLATTGRLIGVSAATACRRLRSLGLDLAEQAGVEIDLRGERRGRPPGQRTEGRPGSQAA